MLQSEFGLPNYRSLTPADKSHLWLACLDLLALAFFVWQVLAESLTSSSDITHNPLSTARLWIALTTRQTCLVSYVWLVAPLASDTLSAFHCSSHLTIHQTRALRLLWSQALSLMGAHSHFCGYWYCSWSCSLQSRHEHFLGWSCSLFHHYSRSNYRLTRLPRRHTSSHPSQCQSGCTSRSR